MWPILQIAVGYSPSKRLVLPFWWVTFCLFITRLLCTNCLKCGPVHCTFTVYEHGLLTKLASWSISTSPFHPYKLTSGFKKKKKEHGGYQNANAEPVAEGLHSLWEKQNLHILSTRTVQKCLPHPSTRVKALGFSCYLSLADRRILNLGWNVCKMLYILSLMIFPFNMGQPLLFQCKVKIQ